MKLTVICPGIRTNNWLKLYNSVQESYNGSSWELIFIGPYDLPKEFDTIDNVKFFKCMRSPIACQQIGLIEASGDYITWAADDGVYTPGSLDESFRLLENKDYKYVVMGKYLEGDTPNKMDTNFYYILSNHDSMKGLPHVPKDALMLNCGVVSRQLLLEVGGWDANHFQVCPMSYSDLAIRLLKYGARFLIQDMIMFTCSHLPGHAGDHGPIHDAQIQQDEPVFRALYSAPGYERILIDLDNWKQSEEVWTRRFGR